MVTELVLLLAVYALLILALFLGPEGMVHTFTNHLPKLSTRIEKHVATGYGFWETNNQGRSLRWSADSTEN